MKPQHDTGVPVSREQIVRHIRRCVATQLVDDSGSDAHGVAIYALSDPRDIRLHRYIGQTRSPRRRLLQHLNNARLWLPDEVPWWIKSPKLRPLYHWIRALYQDEGRLPVMVVSAWVDAEHARVAERTQIFEGLRKELPLLNVETEVLRAQRVLI